MISLKHSGFYGVLITLLVTISGVSTPLEGRDIESAQDARANTAGVDTLVTAEWLQEHLQDPGLVILDATVQVDFSDTGEILISSGRDGFDQGHIPTAQFADLTDDLVDTSSQYPYALPAPEKFASAMGALGVGDDSLVVVYSRDYSAWAARVWWMLRWIGFDNAAVLDGGLAAWNAAGQALSTEVASTAEKTLSVSLRPHVIADRDEVFAAISDEEIILIDAMPAEHYRGEMVMYGRAGHIPTAINVPTVFAEDGHFLAEQALQDLHPFDQDARVITYCGGGISASANAFVMHRLGYHDVAVYMNSLDEWAADSANPLEVN